MAGHKEPRLLTEVPHTPTEPIGNRGLAIHSPEACLPGARRPVSGRWQLGATLALWVARAGPEAVLQQPPGPRPGMTAQKVGQIRGGGQEPRP